MTKETTLRSYGGSLGTTLPKALTDRLKLAAGDKRVGFVAMAVFLDINGWNLEAPEPEVVVMMLAVASGALVESELAAWVRRRSQALSDKD